MIPTKEELNAVANRLFDWPFGNLNEQNKIEVMHLEVEAGEDSRPD